MTRVRHKHPAHLASPVKMYLEKVRYSRTTPTSCDIANWGDLVNFASYFQVAPSLRFPMFLEETEQKYHLGISILSGSTLPNLLELS